MDLTGGYRSLTRKVTIDSHLISNVKYDFSQECRDSTTTVCSSIG